MVVIFGGEVRYLWLAIIPLAKVVSQGKNSPALP
jgi:hypothetical protein